MVQREGEVTINQTINGRIYRCSECNKIHVDYKNLSFTFSRKEYDNYQTYIQQLDPEYWADQNKQKSGEAKIVIPLNHPNLVMKFKAEEIYELKELLIRNLKPEPVFKLIRSRQIDFQLSEN